MDGNSTHSGPVISLASTGIRKLEIAFGLWSNEIVQANSKHACPFPLVPSLKKHVHVHDHPFLLFPLFLSIPVLPQ